MLIPLWEVVSEEMRSWKSIEKCLGVFSELVIHIKPICEQAIYINILNMLLHTLRMLLCRCIYAVWQNMAFVFYGEIGS